MARRSVSAQVSRRMEQAARGVKPANRPALASAAKVFTHGIEGEFARNGLRARSSRLAGTKWKGVLDRSLQGGEQIEVRAANPAHLFNNPTAAHFIVAAGVGGSRRSRAARLGGLGSRTVKTVNAEGDTVRHTQQSRILEGPVIGSRLTGLRQTKASAKGKKALTIGGNLRLYARHRGTRGKPSFGKGRDRVREQAAREYLAQQRRALNWGTTR